MNLSYSWYLRKNWSRSLVGGSIGGSYVFTCTVLWLFSCLVSSLGTDLATMLFSHVVESWKRTNTRKLWVVTVQLSCVQPGYQLSGTTNLNWSFPELKIGHPQTHPHTHAENHIYMEAGTLSINGSPKENFKFGSLLFLGTLSKNARKISILRF